MFIHRLVREVVKLKYVVSTKLFLWERVKMGFGESKCIPSGVMFTCQPMAESKEHKQ